MFKNVPWFSQNKTQQIFENSHQSLKYCVVNTSWSYPHKWWFVDDGSSLVFAPLSSWLAAPVRYTSKYSSTSVGIILMPVWMGCARCVQHTNKGEGVLLHRGSAGPVTELARGDSWKDDNSVCLCAVCTRWVRWNIEIKVPTKYSKNNFLNTPWCVVCVEFAVHFGWEESRLSRSRGHQTIRLMPKLCCLPLQLFVEACSVVHSAVAWTDEWLSFHYHHHNHHRHHRLNITFSRRQLLL